MDLGIVKESVSFYQVIDLTIIDTALQHTQSISEIWPSIDGCILEIAYNATECLSFFFIDWFFGVLPTILINVNRVDIFYISCLINMDGIVILLAYLKTCEDEVLLLSIPKGKHPFKLVDFLMEHGITCE